MDRRFIFGTVAAFTTACATTGPHTASLYAQYWLQERGPVKPVSLLSYDKTMAAWQLPPQNPWAPYTKLTLLAALSGQGEQTQLPDVSQLASVNNAMAAAAEIAASGLPPDVMWVADLRGPAAVAFGTYLSQHAQQPVAVVPTFNNWPAPNELIPAEETLAAVATMLPQAPPADAVGTVPVFLLDAWRLAFRNEDIDEEVIDNRYYLNPSDLPDVNKLREQGIHHIMYVVEQRGDIDTEEDDLNDVFFEYQQAGIAVHLVDLPTLAGYATASAPGVAPLIVWNDFYVRHVYFCRHRETIVHNTGFYLRARGGFGGVGARPWSGRFGVHSSVHSFGGGFGGG